MKRIFTSPSSQRLIFSALLTLGCTLTASAYDTFFAVNAHVDAYPTGAGKIYVSTKVDVPEAERTYADSQDLEFVEKSTYAYAYVKPAEGWQCIGGVSDTLDTNGNWVFVDSIAHNYYSDYGGYVSVSMNGDSFKDEAGNDVDSLTTWANMPLDPNNQVHIIFTRVAADEYDNHDYLGTASISKLANDIGDKVTLTATPKDERCHFVKWTLDGKDVSTEPVIDVNVTGKATYLAHFTCDSAEVIHFAEEGEYKYYYSPDTYITIPSNVTYFELISDSVQSTANGYVAKANNYKYGIYAGTPTMLYGKGDAQIVKTPASPSNNSNNLFRWSGESGVSIDTLDVEATYYTFDLATAVFNKAEGTIAPSQPYIAVPDSVFEKAGTEKATTIYLMNSSDLATAIEAVSTGVSQKAARRGIYDLQGRRLDAINREGIYVFDGKKVIYRKK